MLIGQTEELWLSDWLPVIHASFHCYLHTYQWNGDRLEKRTKCSPLRKYKIYIKLHHQSFSPFRDPISARWWISWQESDCFPKDVMLWSFGIVILTSCIDIVLSQFHSNKRVKSAVAWLSPCLSWWLIPQLSCYHPGSVKRWGWNDDDHIQRCQAFKEIQILDTVWILLTLQFTICQW